MARPAHRRAAFVTVDSREETGSDLSTFVRLRVGESGARNSAGGSADETVMRSARSRTAGEIRFKEEPIWTHSD